MVRSLYEIKRQKSNSYWAASGFGAGIAKKFIEEGAEVIIMDLNEKWHEKLL